MKKVLIVFFAILLFAGSASYAKVVGQTDDSSAIGGGARPVGMGRAFVAIVDDPDAALINPAGLASLKGPGVLTMFTNVLNDVYYREYMGAVPSKIGSFGTGYVVTGVDQIPTIIDGKLVYTDYYDSTLLLSYAALLAQFFDYGKNVYLGGNLKIFNRGWTGGINMAGTGVSADFGVKAVLSPYFSVGFNKQNILPVAMGGVLHWGPGTEESFAGLNKVGIAIKPPFFNRKLLIAFDSDLPESSTRPITSHLGVELEFNELFAIRAGLDQVVDATSASQTTINPTYGASFGYRGLRMDYAYHAYYNDPSLQTNYFSLSYSMEPTFALKGRTE